MFKHLAIITALGFSGLATAESMSVSVNLRSVLGNEIGIRSAHGYSATYGDSAWRDLVTPSKVDMTAVTIKRTPVENQEQAVMSGILRFDFNLRGVTVAFCSSNQKCSDIQLDKDKAGDYNFRLAGDWKVAIKGLPCREERQCSLEIPSSVLDQASYRRYGYYDPFPMVGVVVQHKFGFSIVDAMQENSSIKAEWMRIFAFDAIASLGNLRAASMVQPGVFEYRFAKGSVLQDFPRDRVIIFDTTGVRMAEHAMADWDSATWTTLMARAESDTTADFVGVHTNPDLSGIVAYANGDYLRFDLNGSGNEAGSKLQMDSSLQKFPGSIAAILPLGEHLLVIARSNGKGAVWQLDQGQFAPINAVNLEGLPADKIRFLDGYFTQIGAGIDILSPFTSEPKVESTSLSSLQNQRLLLRNHLLLSMDKPGKLKDEEGKELGYASDCAIRQVTTTLVTKVREGKFNLGMLADVSYGRSWLAAGPSVPCSDYVSTSRKFDRGAYQSVITSLVGGHAHVGIETFAPSTTAQ